MDKRLENRCRRKDDHELLGKSVQISSLRERIASVGANDAARTLIVGEIVTCRLGPFASLYVLGFSTKVTLERFLKGSWSAHGQDCCRWRSSRSSAKRSATVRFSRSA